MTQINPSHSLRYERRFVVIIFNSIVLSNVHKIAGSCGERFDANQTIADSLLRLWKGKPARLRVRD